MSSTYHHKTLQDHYCTLFFKSCIVPFCRWWPRGHHHWIGCPPWLNKLIVLPYFETVLDCFRSTENFGPILMNLFLTLWIMLPYSIMASLRCNDHLTTRVYDAFKYMPIFKSVLSIAMFSGSNVFHSYSISLTSHTKVSSGNNLFCNVVEYKNVALSSRRG